MEVPKLEMAFPSDINGSQLRSNCSRTVTKSAGGPLLAWQAVACKLFTTQKKGVKMKVSKIPYGN